MTPPSAAQRIGEASTEELRRARGLLASGTGGAFWNPRHPDYHNERVAEILIDLLTVAIEGRESGAFERAANAEEHAAILTIEEDVTLLRALAGPSQEEP